MAFASVSIAGETRVAFVDQPSARLLLTDWSDMVELIKHYQPALSQNYLEQLSHQPELTLDLNETTLLAPLPRPVRNLICLGKNYQAHIEELSGRLFTDQLPQYPIYFTKPDHTVIGPNAAILMHKEYTKKLDYEVELAVVIGQPGVDIPAERALEHIFGYTICNDISARDLQQNHTQWFKGKSLTTHCPMGPWIVPAEELEFPPARPIRCYVNGELRQDSNTVDLIFDIPTIIQDLSRGFPLRAGDVILTGTPAGVGLGFKPPRFLREGDEVVCEIEGIGRLVNHLSI
ncbi:MAG TPA: fumarylacetoacetate hydrolase family protein [Clostridiales bacterium]|nr:fumarylacetoacetate hydrolase family protein [Clostridiales bacterium]